MEGESNRTEGKRVMLFASRLQPQEDRREAACFIDLR